MSAGVSEAKGKTTTLHPHQVEFVETVFSPSSKRIVMVGAAPGLGKTFAIAFATARLLREKGDARVLVLCPASLRLQWHEMIEREGVSALIVDRYKFREMLETSAEDDLWSSGTAMILSDDFAKQSDIQENLASVDWDMVVADETHRFSGARGNLLERVAARAGRVVLSSLPGLSAPSGFLPENTTIVDWEREDLVDDKTTPLHVHHPFTQSEHERDLSNKIIALCELLEGRNVFRGQILIRSLHSSPVALERMLRLFAAPENSEDLRKIAGQALKVLEDIPVDTKAAAFMTLVDELSDKGSLPKVCVITNYRNTLYYLAAEFEARDIPFELMTGDMRWDARQESLRSFESTGGILLVTWAAIKDMNLQAIEDVVLYDLPWNPSNLEKLPEQFLGRFDRLGRKSQLTIHMLPQRDDADEALYERLRQKLGQIQKSLNEIDQEQLDEVWEQMLNEVDLEQ